MGEPENPPAFPCAASSPMGDTIYQDGMSLRDWFAGQAICGLLRATDPTGKGPDDIPHMVEVAFIFADAMLAQREKSNG